MDAEPPASIAVIEDVVVPASSAAKVEEHHVPAVVDEPAPNKPKAVSREKSRHERKPVASANTTRVAAPKKEDKGKVVDAKDKGKKRASQPVPKEDAPKTKKARIAEPEPQPSSSRTQRPEQKTARRKDVAPSKPKSSSRTDSRAVASTSKAKSRRTRPRTPSVPSLTDLPRF